jgi:hypothetical protein
MSRSFKSVEVNELRRDESEDESEGEGDERRMVLAAAGLGGLVDDVVAYWEAEEARRGRDLQERREQDVGNW